GVVQESRDHHVLEYSQAFERALDLEGPAHAEPGPGVGSQARYPLPEEIDLSLLGLGVAGQRVEQRRLACTVRSDESEYRACFERQGDVVDGEQAPELDDYAV